MPHNLQKWQLRLCDTLSQRGPGFNQPLVIGVPAARYRAVAKGG